MSLISEITENLEQVQQWRQYLHSIPEIAFGEEKTADFVEHKLGEFGVTVHPRMAGTGIIGSISAGAGEKSIALRADLDALPIITCWPEDGGPFITLPLVYTEHPVDGRHNLGIYRLQRHDSEHLGLHFQIHKGSGYHLMEAERLQRPFPVTCLLGGPPALIASAVAPLPENVGELLLASLLQGAPLRMAQAEGVAHPFVAECEFAIHGSAIPGVRWPEGPFGDHYGYYSLQHDYPVLHVKTLARRRDAIFPATCPRGFAPIICS